jgi:beta-galactosidase
MTLHSFFRRAAILAAATFTILFSTAPFPAAAADARVTQDFDANWLFSRGDFASAMMRAFDDSTWRQVNVPHDWSIEGPFSADYGSGNGYAPGGIGWYRKHFQLDQNQKGRVVTIEFDGVYDYSEVWINGQLVGGRPYGFSSFQFDITPYLKFGADDNVIAVRVDHSRFADSRFYTGSGIYRNVRLVLTDKLRIAHWGTYVTTPKVSSAQATVNVEVTVTNQSDLPTDVFVRNEIYELKPNGEKGAAVLDHFPIKWIKGIAADEASICTETFKLPKPKLWSIENPNLYVLVTSVERPVCPSCNATEVLDRIETPFGIRTAIFDADKGFLLNGVSTKLKGVCLHHDAGPLGAAVPEKVLERRLRLLKEIGVNAIRTSHNPPDPELLDLCDRLGFLVMDEAFDEFTPGKNKWVTGWNNGVPDHFGYNEMFAQWSVTDIQDMVRRDRNHPGIVLWSVGNEVDYANDPFSDPVLGDKYQPENPPASDLLKCAQPLINAVKSLDRTRPVTAALANIQMSDAVNLPELFDAVGYNYQESRYAADHEKFPKRIIYGSENSHQYAAWRAVQTNDFISGQFLWTGIDYLGEAGRWPNRASDWGLLDLCGFKKPVGWFRQSLWSDKPMVYLCVASGNGGQPRISGVESWNWPSNSTQTVRCFANCPEVTLTLNDKVIGTKKLSEAVNGVLSWKVPFEPGTLKAVGRANGQDVCDYELKTAGSSSRIELLPDVTELHADGKDVCHVEFRIVDENGVRVPDAEPEVSFEMSGPASLLGIGNGDLNNSEDCKANMHRAFEGRGLAILETTTIPGSITLKATAPGIGSASVTLQSR